MESGSEVDTLLNKGIPEKHKGHHILSKTEINTLKAHKSELQAVLAQDKETNSRITDMGAIKAKIAKIDRQMQIETPMILKGRSKDTVAARVKELTTQIRQGMPTFTQMQKATSENVQKQIAWQTRTKKACGEYKRCMRTLEPDDPQSGSIERIRPKYVKGRKAQ